MSKYEQREGDIIIFKNDKAEKNQPQYSGYALVNGQEMDIALWVKESKGGRKFMAGRITSKVAPIPKEEIPQETNDSPF
jgi:hypothetical protein